MPHLTEQDMAVLQDETIALQEGASWLLTQRTMFLIFFLVDIIGIQFWRSYGCDKYQYFEILLTLII